MAEHSVEQPEERVPPAGTGVHERAASPGAAELEPDLWLREARTTVAAQDRSRRHWLAQQAAEAATLRGVLRDGAERGAQLTVHDRAGCTSTGVALSVGADVLALRTQGGSTMLVRLDAVFAVRVEGTAAPGGDRRSPTELTMRQALATAVVDRPRVQLSCANATPVIGVLTEVGDELAHVRLDNGARIVVVLDAITTALLR